LVVREAERWLRSAELFHTIQNINNNENDRENDETMLNAMRERVAILQHHDAITGTCRDNVAKDYVDMADEAVCIGAALLSNDRQISTSSSIVKCSRAIRLEHFSSLKSIDQVSTPPTTTTTTTEEEQYILFNSLGWKRKSLIHLPCPSSKWVFVFIEIENPLNCQVIELIKFFYLIP
jgi:hypothetical protein